MNEVAYRNTCTLAHQCMAHKYSIIVPGHTVISPSAELHGYSVNPLPSLIKLKLLAMADSTC